MKFTKNDFPFGTIVNSHRISSFEIIEYIVGENWIDAGKIQFTYHNCTYDTLDEAILGAICDKYSDGDSNLFSYVTRLFPGLTST
jgi:hypothetical protein